MARVDLAAGLLFLSVVIAVSAHPPHAGEFIPSLLLLHVSDGQMALGGCVTRERERWLHTHNLRLAIYGALEVRRTFP